MGTGKEAQAGKILKTRKHKMFPAGFICWLFFGKISSLNGLIEAAKLSIDLRTLKNDTRLKHIPMPCSIPSCLSPARSHYR